MLSSIAFSLGLASIALGQSSTAPPPAATTPATPPPPPPPAGGAPTNDGIPPLASLRFNYTNLPYQVDPNNGIRGPQSGYNICNSTTEGPASKCQTAFVNAIDDFCLWSAPDPESEIGDIEHEAVAWCTKPGRGTRIIPEGTLTAVQFLKAPAYVQVTGRFNQVHLNLKADDFGGEMDPHGADLRGNPVGGLVFSNAFGGGGNNFIQVIEWHNFIGGGTFCFKACDPAGAQDDRYCEHIFDRIGCAYNAPASYAPNEFTSCDSENQDFPGVFTNAAGVTETYRQPPESLGPIATVTYTPRTPASSNCQTYTSSVLYSAMNAAAPRPTTTTTSSGTNTNPSASRTSGGSQPTNTSAASGVAPKLGFVAAIVASVFAITL